MMKMAARQVLGNVSFTQLSSRVDKFAFTLCSDSFCIHSDAFWQFLYSCDIHSGAFRQFWQFVYSFNIHYSAVWQFFLLHIIFTAVQWVLMISPRVNVWVTTIIWRYNIHCSTHHIKEKEKRKRVMREVWRHSVCRRAAIYTQYISLFNQFFD